MRLQFNIIQNQNVTESIVKETKRDLTELTIALEDFRQLVNTAMTKKIDQAIDTSSDNESMSSDEEIGSPKRKKV